MTDEPSWPGVTLPSYQPARLWLASGGTCTPPPVSRPSRMIGADTRSAGISIRTGTDPASGAAVGRPTGPGTCVPTPAGMAVARPPALEAAWPLSTRARPSTVPPTTISRTPTITRTAFRLVPPPRRGRVIPGLTCWPRSAKWRWWRPGQARPGSYHELAADRTCQAAVLCCFFRLWIALSVSPAPVSSAAAPPAAPLQLAHADGCGPPGPASSLRGATLWAGFRGRRKQHIYGFWQESPL